MTVSNSRLLDRHATPPRPHPRDSRRRIACTEPYHVPCRDRRNAAHLTTLPVPIPCKCRRRRRHRYGRLHPGRCGADVPANMRSNSPDRTSIADDSRARSPVGKIAHWRSKCEASPDMVTTTRTEQNGHRQDQRHRGDGSRRHHDSRSRPHGRDRGPQSLLSAALAPVGLVPDLHRRNSRQARRPDRIVRDAAGEGWKSSPTPTSDRCPAVHPADVSDRSRARLPDLRQVGRVLPAGQHLPPQRQCEPVPPSEVRSAVHPLQRSHRLQVGSLHHVQPLHARLRRGDRRHGDRGHHPQPGSDDRAGVRRRPRRDDLHQLRHVHRGLPGGRADRSPFRASPVGTRYHRDDLRLLRRSVARSMSRSNKGIVRRVTNLWERGVNHGYTCETGKWGHERSSIRTGSSTRASRRSERRLPTRSPGRTQSTRSPNRWRTTRAMQFAALVSPDATNEEAYALQQFTRAVMGTNNIDRYLTRARPRSSSGVRAGARSRRLATPTTCRSCSPT